MGFLYGHRKGERGHTVILLPLEKCHSISLLILQNSHTRATNACRGFCDYICFVNCGKQGGRVSGSVAAAAPASLSIGVVPFTPGRFLEARGPPCVEEAVVFLRL